MEIMKLTIKEDFHRGTVFFLVFLSQIHIIWKEIWHEIDNFNFHVPFKTSCEFGQIH